jgi:hypothetical protein
MEEAIFTPQGLVMLAYSLAALIGLSAGLLWMRFANVRRSATGGAQSFRWLTEAATATGLAMFIASAGFLFSLLV